jgi:hypothetical protein
MTQKSNSNQVGTYCEKCDLRANYGHTRRFPLRCESHKTEDMVNVMLGICQECTKQANFGINGSSPTRCSTHKTHEMVLLRNYRLCEICTRRARYGVGNLPTRCSMHKMENMRNTSIRKCNLCPKNAYYGYQGQPSQRCKYHKEESMSRCKSKTKPVGTIHKRSIKTQSRAYCIECDKIASFGYLNNAPIACKMHAFPGMIPRRGVFCDFDQCKKQASHGFPKTSLTRCSQHKESGMVELKNRKCDMCTKIAVCGVVGGKKVRCASHKTDDMIYLSGYFCEECHRAKIQTHASYGFPGRNPHSCSKHKTDGMIVDPKSKCRENNCKNHAVHGFLKPTHCHIHKDKDMINFVERVCNSCGLLEKTDDDGICSYCNPALCRKMCLRKQRVVKQCIDNAAHIPQYETYDTILDHGVCGKERPDFVWDCASHKVILEVDENQHKSYPAQCEIKRMWNITQGIGMPVLWIRYNPDSYVGQPAWLKHSDRTQILLTILKCAFQDTPQTEDDTCRVKYIFYDGYDPEKMIYPLQLVWMGGEELNLVGGRDVRGEKN